ncbi:MAG: ISAzo13 family transposase [Candidatus Entotheonellia bacterium]
MKVLATLDEGRARWYVAQKAIELGHGGIQKVHELTGIARPTMMKGMRELRDPKGLRGSERLRRVGGGRKRLEGLDPTLRRDLDRLMDENTRGDPMNLLRWSRKSTERLAAEMTQLGHPMSADTVRRLLHQREYSLQANVKVKEGERQPDRDGQFRSINAQVKAWISHGDPVMSVDTKKKARVGEFKTPGQTWRTRGQPREVLVYDFPHLGVGTAIPYGTYDGQKNQGLVNVGMTHDTAELAVESIRRWWHQLGRQHYPRATRMVICADGGGSHGSRSRGWKFCVQPWVDEVGFPVMSCHDPLGTSKWNQIAHRKFSFISVNWRGEPLVSYETVINLISTTTTKTGLQIKALLDTSSDECGMKISDAQMRAVQLKPHAIHPQWNYTIFPRRAAKPRASPKK